MCLSHAKLCNLPNPMPHTQVLQSRLKMRSNIRYKTSVQWFSWCKEKMINHGSQAWIWTAYTVKLGAGSCSPAAALNPAQQLSPSPAAPMDTASTPHCTKAFRTNGLYAWCCCFSCFLALPCLIRKPEENHLKHQKKAWPMLKGCRWGHKVYHLFSSWN